MKRPHVWLHRLAASAILFAGFVLTASSQQPDPRQSWNSLNEQVLDLYAEGFYDEALVFAELALEQAEASFDKADPDRIASLHNLAELYQLARRYSDARPLMQQVIEIETETKGQYHRDTLAAINDLAILLDEEADYAASVELFRRAADLALVHLGPDDADTLSYRNNLADTLAKQGRYAEAEPLFVDVLERRRLANGILDPDSITSANNLAVLYWRQGRYDEAEPLYSETLVASETLLGREHAFTIGLLGNLAALRKSSGDLAGARSLYEDAVRRSAHAFGEADIQTLETEGDLAGVLVSLGEYGRAGSIYENLLRTSKAHFGATHPSTLSALNDLAGVYDSVGRFVEAEAMYREALDGKSSVFGEKHDSTITTQINLGALYRLLGRYGEAELLLRKSVDASLAGLGSDHPLTLSAMSHLGGLYRVQGRLEEASVILADVLEKRTRKLGEQHYDTVSSINSLANAYRLQGRLVEAEALLRRALAARTALFGSDHPSTLASMNDLAGLLLSAGHTDMAGEIYVDVYEATRSLSGPETPRAMVALNNLATFYSVTGRTEQALGVLTSGIPVVEGGFTGNEAYKVAFFGNMAELLYTHLGLRDVGIMFEKRAVNALQASRLNMDTSGEEAQASFVGKNRRHYETLRDWLIREGRFAEAEQVGRMLKEAEYFGRLSPQDHRSTSLGTTFLAMNATEQRWISDMAQWIADEGQSSLSGRFESRFQSFLGDLQKRPPESSVADALENDLRLQTAAQARMAAVAPDATLVQVVSAEDSTHFFITTANSFKHIEAETSSETLYRAIFELHSAMQSSSATRAGGPAGGDAPDTEQLSDLYGRLYDMLFDPVAEEVSRAGNQVLLLDLQGQTRYVPFAALFDGEKFLAERYEISLVTPNTGQSALDSMPLQTASGFGVSRAFEGFSALPNVKAEIESIISASGEASVFKGQALFDEAFTFASFRDALTSEVSVLHIASHFWMQPGDDSNSYLLLGDGSRLTLAEILRDQRLRFDSVSLVTLSACSTAISSEGTGSEIEGFAVVAQAQGAKSVLATLWNVADRSSPVFMESFYRNLKSGNLTKSGAMAAAQRELIASEAFRDPYYWAPYILLGDWR